MSADGLPGHLRFQDSKALHVSSQTHPATSAVAALFSVPPQTWDTYLTSPSAHAVSILENLSVLIAKYKQNQPLLSPSGHHRLLQRQMPGPALLLDPPAQRNSHDSGPSLASSEPPVTDAPPLLGPLLPGSLGSGASCSNVTSLFHPLISQLPLPPPQLVFLHAFWAFNMLSAPFAC